MGVVETITKRLGVKRATSPIVSVACWKFPNGRTENPSTELGLRGRGAGVASNGYRPRMRVVFTTLLTAPNPLVAKCENAIPLSSPETNAVCLVPRNPR